MIKRIFFAGLFILLTQLLTAQYKPMVFGLRIGGSVDWMKPDADQYTGEGVRPGFSWGFVADFFFMENYSIQTGFNVQYLHGKLKYPEIRMDGADALSGILTRNYNLQYIQVPVVLKMQAEVAEKIRLFGKIGLGTAFRLRAKADDSFSYDEGLMEESKVDIAEEITLIRESFIIGGGISYILNGSTELFVDVTFDNGFVNILKDYNTANPDVKQKAVMNFVELSVGVIF